jgi:hypothetical protein
MIKKQEKPEPGAQVKSDYFLKEIWRQKEREKLLWLWD